jgi:hypothetical protein
MSMRKELRMAADGDVESCYSNDLSKILTPENDDKVEA